MITTTRFRAPRLPSPVLLALIGILSLAFLIRIVGIDWDEGRYLHPDERHIVADVLIDRVELSWPPSTSWLDPDQSPINPRPEREGGGYEGFAYGTFPVYTVDILGSTATELTGDDWTGYDRIEYIGRALSILLDTATVLLAYLIGARLVSTTAGLVGAAIYAFLPLAIQASHFFIVDSWLTFFLAASLYTCINAVTSRSMWQFPLAAAWYGLAMATKTTAAPFAGVIILAIALAALQESRTASSFTIVAGRAGARSVVSLTVFLAVFMFGEPFAFIQPDAYLDSFRQQADIQSGTWDVPFTQQYVGTPRGAYQLREAVRYSMGPIAALVGMAGAMGLPWLAWRRKSPEMLVLAAWIGGFALVILYPETKWPRYTLPLAPALAVCAGIAIAGAAHYLRRRTGRALAIGFTALLLTISTGWGAAFAQVTMEEHTRLAASIWLFENLPPGSTTTSEIWDDRLPLSLGPGHSADARRIDDASINLYTYTPTLGDIARLGPAVAELPRGHRMATLLEVGRVDEALEIIRSLATTDFAAQQAADAASTEASSALRTRPDATPDRAATFQFELIRASSAMTTSRDLSVSVQQIAGDVALDNAISPAMLEQLAASIEASASRTSPDEIHALLEDADAYVVASDRVERGMDQNPWRYAVPVRMYELLDSGELGYGQARSFHSYPSLFGLTFSDAGADETFINYDHPVVRVYEKQARTEDLPVVELFGSAALAQTDPSRDPDTEPMTFDEPVSDLPIVDDYRWSESLTGSSWGAAAVWIVMLVALQAAAWPLARSVFRSFPDSGWGLTRLVGMLVPATALWWLSSVGLIQFLSVWVAVTSALFALACWWLLHRETVPAPGSRWRTIGVAEGIFWATFAVFLVYKLINPDSWHPYWGGEKPMEFAQINAILRSPSFPPVDPWYAQGYINYYYYSFYLVAFLIKLTGIPTEYAFNLAQPMVMGMLASATFSVGAMLGSRITKGRQNGIMSGLISVALVSFAGNMMSVGQLVDGLQGEEPTLDPFSHWVWNPSRAILDNGAQLITEFPYFTGLYGDLHSHVMGMPLLVLSVGIAATFAFDFPRLHELGHRRNVARLMVSVIALGVIYPTNAWDLPVTAGVVAGGMLVGSATQHWIRPRLTSLGLIAVPITIGALIVSLPFVLRFEALFGEIETVRATTSVLELETHAGGLLLVATATIPLLIATITLSSRSRTVMFWAYPVLAILLLARWLATDRAPDAVSLLDKTTAILVASIWVLAIGAPRGPRQRFDFRLPKFTTLVLGIAGMAAVMSFVVDDNPVAALYVGIAAGSTCVWLWKRPTSLRFLALLVAGAGYIGAGVEIVFLVDDLAGTDWARMNTVFKFYNQIWILLAIAGGSTAGVFVTAFLTRLARAGTPGGVTRQLWRLQLPAMSSFVTALVLLLATAYPIAATGVRLDARFEPREGGPTLNAYDWMEYGSVQLTDGTVIGFEEDRDVIDWFNAQVGGTPVIAEAAFAPYRCNSSRISIGTGLPSVLGWARHEMQQRHPEVLPQRDADLRTLYASQDPNEKLSILNRYDVHYVIVGDLERSYPVVAGNDCVPMGQSPLYRHLDLGAGVGTFEEMVGENLEVAFQSGDTIVYRVVGNT